MEPSCFMEEAAMAEAVVVVVAVAVARRGV
jgi:hypothetical protein